MRQLRPPQELRLTRPCLFLAGSIEMGRAVDWQQQAVAHLADLPGTVLNPRREHWDSSWRQEAADARFREQVEWELAGMESADLIACYLSPQTRSPISLLEIGLWARSGKLLVGCPQGFWRRGNVEIVCERYGAPLADSFEGLLTAILDRVSSGRTGSSGR